MLCSSFLILEHCGLYNVYIIDLDNDTGVQIGFDEEFYPVNESSGLLTLGVTVLEGQLSNSVVIQLSTQDNTAQGETA